MTDAHNGEDAPGAPGIALNWCDGAKQMVGTSLGPARVWFTVGQGILNEVYYPRVDIPQIRDLGFIVADGAGFWVEVKALQACEITTPEPGIPAVQIVHRHPRFTLIQRLVPEPNRDVMLLEIALEGDAGLRPYVLLAPHLGGTGQHNHAEAGHFRGRRALWAQQGPFGLALMAVNEAQSDVFGHCSAGYTGISDGWQDFDRHGQLQSRYTRAGPGQVALAGELPRRACLALGFATSREAAATLALSALLQPFEMVWQQQCDHWRDWHMTHASPVTRGTDSLTPELRKQLHISAMVLRTHHDQTYRGAMVASLSVPWGEHTEERPGYHLVWPRDLVECAGALLALGAVVEAREVLRYLITTQREDGSWYQNQWLGSKPFWTGIQLDQVAFPILLAGMLADRDELDGIEVGDMVRRAVGFIIRNGPVSPQDRWEEKRGVNVFTLSVCIAGMVSGARFLATAAEGFVLELADYWNASLETWTAVYDTVLARQQGVKGYYLRITPAEALHDPQVLTRIQSIKNRRNDPGLAANAQLGVDVLQLVRFGLRSADDPLVRDTLKVVDASLRVELPQGPCWYRYTGDGYGEHEDGRAYDGTGRGRLWPLLTGERGHYELVRGADAIPYLQAMANMAGQGGMLPEQVWDKADIVERGLLRGRPTHSAMPLAWTHAEYVKLAYSILEGRPVDRPDPLWSRYHGLCPQVHIRYWSPQAPIGHISRSVRLGFCLPWPARVVWWSDITEEQQITTRDFGLGVHVVRLPLLPKQAAVLYYRFEAEHDQGQTRSVEVRD